MKFKFFTTISFVCLAIMLTLVGIWAVADLDFAVGGDITYTAPKPQINLQQDSKGFYVEMGTYNNAPVVWRLVGLNGAKFTDTTAPTSGTGTFILETIILIRKVFDETNFINDYASSDIRKYIANEYLEELAISANDTIYSAITKRTMSDLYTNIGWNYNKENSDYDENAVYSITTSNTESDKLWLMSVAEIYTMLGGGYINTNATIPTDWSSVSSNLDWDTNSLNTDRYWLRSANPYYSEESMHITAKGIWGTAYIESLYVVRPAFNIEF